MLKVENPKNLNQTDRNKKAMAKELLAIHLALDRFHFSKNSINNERHQCYK
jgi:hypothetical protein